MHVQSTQFAGMTCLQRLQPPSSLTRHSTGAFYIPQWPWKVLFLHGCRHTMPDVYVLAVSITATL